MIKVARLRRADYLSTDDDSIMIWKHAGLGDEVCIFDKVKKINGCWQFRDETENITFYVEWI